MVTKGEATDYINNAIDASIEFEKLMEQIDFNSWCEKIDNAEKVTPDTMATFKNQFDKKAFEKYRTLVKDAEGRCSNFINDDLYKTLPLDDSGDKTHFVKSLIHYLFKAKLNRLEARRTFTPNIERNKYIEAANRLNVALNRIPLNYLKRPLSGHRKKDYDLLIILFYNDLSICYAGFKNSSMSRGFAEESIKLLERDKDYKNFRKMIDSIETKITQNKSAEQDDYKKLLNLPFVSGKSKKYDLYTFALFCKGMAEFRSFLKEEAEKTFMTIINFAEKYRCPKNSDYHSSLVHFASLLNDLSRSKEAIIVIEKLEKKKLSKFDRRYAEGLLEKASASIDQGSYEQARETLENISDFSKLKGDAKRYTEQILNGLIYYGRSFLEEAKNMLPVKAKYGDKEKFLKDAQTYLKEALDRSRHRKQKSLIQKAAKYLAEANETNTKKTLYYSISISEGAVNSFEALLEKDIEDLDDFVRRCEDIPLLKDFSNEILEYIRNESPKEKAISLCNKLLDKLKEECIEKEKLDTAEWAERRKEELVANGCNAPEILAGSNFEKCYDTLTGKENHEKSEFLKAEQIKARLDANEESFDRILYKRTNAIMENSIVELVVLRRWNSFSPALSRKYDMSLGGGYLLRIKAPEFKTDNTDCVKGTVKSVSDDWFNLVIDPGYNFLLNFHSEKFSIEDIDAVVVTHSHPDHCAELSAIMDLMGQINKRQKKQKNRKKIYLLLSRGAYKKFSSYIRDWKDQLKDILLLENDTIWPKKNNKEFEIKSIKTAHADLGGERAVGLTVKTKIGKNILFGFIGDTPWRKDIRNFFETCDILCLHIGSVKNYEIGYDKNNKRFKTAKVCLKEILKETKDVNHLHFYGSCDIINKCDKNAIVIVSEFGEELKYGLRIDLVKKLDKLNKALCIAADTGLYFIVTRDGEKLDKKIRCDFCEGFVSPKAIKIFPYGLIDSLHYICDPCSKTLNESQKRVIVDYKLTRH